MRERCVDDDNCEEQLLARAMVSFVFIGAATVAAALAAHLH